jgi:hypothetical protein
MSNFQRLNNIGGWSVFAIALLTYTLTVEPTASFWDCGEFIACAYKLQVPHPAGAPFFLLVGRMASFLAGGDVTKVALMVNMVSVITSAFTILFMFWTISLLARKIFGKTGNELNSTETILVLGASVVGSLIYTFSDSFWFSAVEAEVYGMSSFFTAIVIWAAFRWELIEDEAAANRWLIFTAYLVGLSIGVHLLNLVTIPALALIYYFKKAKNITWKGGIIAFMIGMVILGIINVGIITGLPSIAFSFEKIFVNNLGMPFSSGSLFFVILFIGVLAYGIFYTQKKEKVIANTVLLCLAFIMIGYASYTIALIRSTYNPPINENNPSNVLNYVSYLKREQYGSRPLFYGPVFTGQLEAIENGEPVYKMGKNKYEIYNYRPNYVWAPNSESLLPRMWSSDPSHKAVYMQEMGMSEGQKPTLFTNIAYMFKRQMGYMYMRYFLWNFWGRAADIEGAGPTNIFESKAKLPSSLRDNKGRTNFYALPLILGIIGFLFHYFRREREALVLLLLFLFTGLALVFFLNAPPVEPRERDYIYVGSFYIFAIWAGLGIIGIYEWFLKKMNKSGAIAASGIGLAISVLIVSQTWKGHDRSGRYHQIDFAKNMLNSCAPNAILFTGGDNDTFPLWYAQEVEGFRTDVRVCNLSLLGTDWYCEQMKRKTYQSEALPVTFTTDQLLSGINDQIPFIERLKQPINLKEYLELVKRNDPAIQVPLQNGESINTLPSDSLFLNYDIENVRKLGFVSKQFEPYLTGQMMWNIGKRDLLKNDLMQLEIIAQNNWKRPVYFASSLAPDNYLNLKDFMQFEGYAYRLMPFKVSEGGEEGFIDTDLMSEKMLKKMAWRNTENPNVYYDSETYLKVPVVTARIAFSRLASQLIAEGKKEKANQILDYANKVLPDKTIPYDQLCSYYVMSYFEIGETKKAMQIAEAMAKRAEENLIYFAPKLGTKDAQWMPDNVRQYVEISLRNLQVLGSILHQNKQEATAKRYEELFNRYAK